MRVVRLRLLLKRWDDTMIKSLGHGFFYCSSFRVLVLSGLRVLELKEKRRDVRTGVRRKLMRHIRQLL
jgi:hypothetical protein